MSKLGAGKSFDAGICAMRKLLACVLIFAFGAAALADDTGTMSPQSSGVSSIHDWSGPYFGLNLTRGVSDGSAERTLATGFVVETDVANGLFPDDINDRQYATISGVALGYNIQRGNFVGGLALSLSANSHDVDFGFSNIDPAILVGVDTVTRYRTEIDNLLSLKARAGYAMDDNLFYATAGVATGSVNNAFTLDLTDGGIPQLDFEEIDRRWGYTVGVGVERRITDHISVMGEVSFYDLQNVTVEARAPTIFPDNALDYTFRNNGFAVTIGLNFSF